jgi:hypothetical protein
MVKESQKVWKKLTSLEPRRANGVDTHGTLDRGGKHQTRLSQVATEASIEWFEAHQSHPYPTNVDKASLEAATGLGPQQSTIGSQMLGDGVLAICRLLLSAMGMAARMRETTTSLPWPQQRYTSARFVTVSLLQSTTGSATRWQYTYLSSATFAVLSDRLQEMPPRNKTLVRIAVRTTLRMSTSHSTTIPHARADRLTLVSSIERIIWNNICKPFTNVTCYHTWRKSGCLKPYTSILDVGFVERVSLCGISATTISPYITRKDVGWKNGEDVEDLTVK